MVDRLSKAFGISFLPLLPGALLAGMIHLGCWSAAVIAAAGTLCTLSLGGWMLGLDRAFPGSNRVRVSDGLLEMTVVLPFLALLSFAAFQIETTALSVVSQLATGVLAYAVLHWRLAPALTGPPEPPGFHDALAHFRLAKRRNGLRQRPAASGNVRRKIDLRIEWTNDANGTPRIVLRASGGSPASFTVTKRGRLEWARGVRTGDAKFDEVARVDGDSRHVLAWLDDESRDRASAAVLAGGRYSEGAWHFDGVAPAAGALIMVVTRLVDAAEAFARPREPDALARRVLDDRAEGVRLACLRELLMIGQHAPREALADAHVPVRVLAAIGLGDDPDSGAILERDAIPTAAALLAEFDDGPIAERLIAIIARRSGRSAVKALASFAARTSDDALRTAAKAAIDRVEQRADGEAGHLSVDDSHTAGRLSEPLQQGQLSLKDPRQRSRT